MRAFSPPIFLRAIALVSIISLLTAGVALADTAEGDFTATSTGTANVTAGLQFSLDVELFVVRQSAGNIVETVSWSVTANTCGAGAAGAASPTSFTLPSTWPGEDFTTRSIDLDEPKFSSATIAATAGAAGGSCTVTYTGTPTASFNGQGIPPGERTVTFTINFVAPTDSTAPVITPSVVGTLGNNGWYTSDVTVTFTVSDPESAITSKSADCDAVNEVTADTTGVTFTCTATSAGGTATESVTIKRDATPPVVVPGDVIDTTWRNTNLAQAFTASDAMSGLAVPSDASFTLTASLESTLDASDDVVPTVASKTVADDAGNTTTRIVSAWIDKTKPTISGAVSPTAPDGQNGWYVSAPTVTFSCNDALSGIASCLADGESTNQITLGESAVAQSVGGTATDNAGNVETATVSGLLVDLSDPYSVEFSNGPLDGASYVFGSVPAEPTCTADDDISGIDSCLVSGYSAGVGSHTMTATATDVAGRTAFVTRSYTVLAWTVTGFHRPVDTGATLNVIKGGSTVPLKFNVFAGTTELTSTSAIKGFEAREFTCGAFSFLPAEEITITSTGQTSLRYDSTERQFIQNWKTDKTKDKCYAAIVTFQDDTSIWALFQTK